MQFIRRALIWLGVLKKPEPVKPVMRPTPVKMAEIARMCDAAAKAACFDRIGLRGHDLYYQVVGDMLRLQDEGGVFPERRELVLLVHTTAARLKRDALRRINGIALSA